MKPILCNSGLGLLLALLCYGCVGDPSQSDFGPTIFGGKSGSGGSAGSGGATVAAGNGGSASSAGSSGQIRSGGATIFSDSSNSAGSASRARASTTARPPGRRACTAGGSTSSGCSRPGLPAPSASSFLPSSALFQARQAAGRFFSGCSYWDAPRWCFAALR